jgi:hypothetical protein
MATSSPYAIGMKKPMNMMEAPVYPNIRKGPPRFVWSKKHWTVDTGATMMSTEPFTQTTLGNAVLAQSRDYNKTIYGQSSHRDVVNAEFRPPLISYYEDVGPLTRVPTKIETLVPRINPTTSSQGGTSGYLAKNDRPSDIEKTLTDRVKRGEERPTFYAPYDIPQDNSVLPDLSNKLPSVSLTSGWTFDYRNTLTPKEIELREKLSAIPLKPGLESILKITGKSDLENYQAKNVLPRISGNSGMNIPIFTHPPQIETFEFDRKLPSISVDAGVNTPVHFSGDMEGIIEELSYNRPQVSVDAGKSTIFSSSNFETPVDELSYNRPQVSVDAGKSTIFSSSNFETPVDELSYNRPQISVDAGKTTFFSASNFETPVDELSYNRPQISVDAGKTFDYYHSDYPDETPIHLSEKLSSVPIHVSNPGTDENAYFDLDSLSYVDPKYINHKRQHYSYEVTKEVPAFREQNVLTEKKQYREKLEPLKSYASGHSQTGSFMPKFGIEEPRSTVKEKKNRLAVNRKKPVYKI